MKTGAASASLTYGLSVEQAIEEFRRLILIKTFVMDVNATKISPTAMSKSPHLIEPKLNMNSGPYVACSNSGHTLLR